MRVGSIVSLWFLCDFTTESGCRRERSAVWMLVEISTIRAYVLHSRLWCRQRQRRATQNLPLQLQTKQSTTGSMGHWEKHGELNLFLAFSLKLSAFIIPSFITKLLTVWYMIPTLTLSTFITIYETASPPSQVYNLKPPKLLSKCYCFINAKFFISFVKPPMSLVWVYFGGQLALNP